MTIIERNTLLIKAEAKRLGFMNCGFSEADFLEDEAPQLTQWLKEKRNGEMKYMENYFDMRLDPRLLVDDAKTVISLSYNYFTLQIQADEDAPKISKYAYGTDYHSVIKDKLKELFFFIRQLIGDVSGRAFVDSAPIMDKAWAKRAGIGWMGKNTNIISPKSGSFFFLSELVVDFPLIYDNPIKDYCGTCRKCINACPTKALNDTGQIDGSRCISYLTIELKNAIPEEFRGKMDNWMFGCDVCQSVCPWNRFSKTHNEPKFDPHPDLLKLSKSDWRDLSEDIFKVIFKNSPVKRTKYVGLMRNIDFLS